MSKTMIELSTRALQRLRVIGGSETASAADAAFLQTVYQAKLQEIESRAIAAIDYNAIPDAYFEALAHWLAACVAIDFGKIDFEDDEIALRKLRRVVAKPYMGRPAQPDYY